MGEGGDGWNVVGLFIVALSGVVFDWTGTVSYVLGVLVTSALFTKLQERWALSKRSFGVAVFLWPYAWALLPFLVRRKEKERRLRLARSILNG